MADLTFITDDKLRSMIERDKNELDRCLEHNLYEATMLLAGSIIEAMLVDCFLAFPDLSADRKVSEDQVQRADLAQLVAWAAEGGVISRETQDLATVVREYRNLIHPGREKRESQRIDGHRASVAASLVEIISEELIESYVQHRGQTCEQVITKLKHDPSSMVILDSLLDSMSSVEQERLFHRTPGIWLEDPSLSEDDIERLILVHQDLKDRIDSSLVKQGAYEAYERIRDHIRSDAMRYLRFFIGDLEALPCNLMLDVLRYVLDAIATASSEELEGYISWSMFYSLGKNFDTDERLGLLMACITGRFQRRPPDQEELRTYYDEEVGYYAKLYCDEGRAFTRIMSDLLNGVPYERAHDLVDRLSALSWPKGVASWAQSIELIPF